MIISQAKRGWKMGGLLRIGHRFPHRDRLLPVQPDGIVDRRDYHDQQHPGDADGASNIEEPMSSTQEMDRRLPEVEHQRSEEHTSELQSHSDLVCRLLLEKKKKTDNNIV